MAMCEPTAHRFVQKFFLPTPHRLLESRQEPTFHPPRVIRCRFIFSRVIRCRFIFSGKNDEPTPDFPHGQFSEQWLGNVFQTSVPDSFQRFVFRRPSLSPRITVCRTTGGRTHRAMDVAKP